jgi:hypothetical protein
MTNIIVQGFKSNKLITQGYHAGAAVVVTGGDSSLFYYQRKKKPTSEMELFTVLANLLRKLRGS